MKILYVYNCSQEVINLADVSISCPKPPPQGEIMWLLRLVLMQYFKKNSLLHVIQKFEILYFPFKGGKSFTRLELGWGGTYS